MGVGKNVGRESGMIKIGVLRHFLQALSIKTRDEPTDEHGNQCSRVGGVAQHNRQPRAALTYSHAGAREGH